MRIFNRILYAFTVAILLIVVNNMANKLTANKYFDTEGKLAFENQLEERYRMFYGPTGYHEKSAKYSYEVNEYKIQFFQVNKLFSKKEGKDSISYLVEEYFYIIIEHPTHELVVVDSQRYYMKFVFEDEHGKEKLWTLRIHQFRNLPFYTVVDDNDKALIPIEDLLEFKLVGFDLIDYDHNKDSYTSLAKQEFSINVLDLIDKDYLIKYYDNKDKLADKGIYMKYKVDTSKYKWVYYLIISAYILTVVILTYFIFFFKKKKMGRVKPSKHFNK